MRRPLRWLPPGLAAIAVCMAGLIVHGTAITAIHGYFELPMGDSWPLLPLSDGLLAGAPIDWHDLWSQVNEHRIVFMRSGEAGKDG